VKDLKVKDYSSKKEIAALGILVLLSAFTYLQPLFLEDTIDLRLYLKIPWVFWITLAYGLTFPFITRWLRNPKVIALWGTIVYVLFWSYFTIAEPQLRYPDSYVHSRSASLMTTYGANPSVDQYLLWPNSFIFQNVLSSVTGLDLLTLSRILAVALVSSLGLTLMSFFSVFLEDSKKALLCLYITFILPNTLMLNNQHYSPQLFAYVLALLVITISYTRAKAGRQVETGVVLILMLAAIVFSNPTTTLWITPILIAIWIFRRYTVRSQWFPISGILLILYFSIVGIWWVQPAGLNITESLVGPFWQRFQNMLHAGQVTLSEGLFRPSFQPLYSPAIRRFTFAFVGVLIVPALLGMIYRVYKYSRRRTALLNKDDAFSAAVIVGSLVGTGLFWIGAAGGFGDRTWGILVPILAIFYVKSIIILSKRKKLRVLGLSLTAIALILIPLNFVATNYTESLNQTTLSEAVALGFASNQSFHDQNVFSDSAYSLGRFSYAMPNTSNLFFSQSSQLLDPSVADNSTYLENVRYSWSPYMTWTLFIHTEQTTLLMYARYGARIGEWQDFNMSGIDKIYDNGEIKIYERDIIPGS
jgi:hypothetical protein